VPTDARQLPRLLGRDARFDLVLSSPPYGGTYDYVAHHARRYAWLGLDPSALERGEIGARRRLSEQQGGARRFASELSAALGAIAAVCAPRAKVVLLFGDAEVEGVRIEARAQLEELGARAGLEATRRAARAGGRAQRP